MTQEKANKMRLIAYRDHLFDKYLEIYDKYEKWTKGDGMLVHYRVTGKKETKKQVAFMIKNHLMEISEDLRELDDKICKQKSPYDIYVLNSEIY